MNKRAGIFLGVALGLLIWVFGILFLPFLTDSVDGFRTSLDCVNSGSITGGTMLVCLMGDVSIPYFIWFLASLALGLVVGGLT